MALGESSMDTDTNLITKCLPIAIMVVGIWVCIPFSVAQQPASNTEPTLPQSQSAHREESVAVEIPIQHNFLLYLPEDYDQQESVPLMLFLHGAGERGNQLDRVAIHGPPKLIKAGKKFPCMVVSPQCEKDRWWEPLELLALLDHLEANYKVDRSRVYVTGLSMGGYGTWALAQREPNRFAAIAPICGGGNARFLKHSGEWTTPVWAFHGARDSVVPANETLEMVSALRQKGVHARLTIYSDTDHDSWNQAYDNQQLYDWMFAQRRTPKQD